MEIKEIRSVKHCFLCQKRKHLDQIGTICSLINERGVIDESCADFEFREDIDEYIEQQKENLKEAEYALILLRKQMIKWFLIGLFMTTFGLIFWTMPWNYGAIHILTVSLIIVGMILMPQGAWEFFPHRMRLHAKHHEIKEFLILVKYYKGIKQ